MEQSLNILYHEITWGAHRAYRTIIPELQDRIPLTWSTAPYPLACYIPFVFLAYLARRPDTYLIRLLLLPTVVFGILAAAYRYVWVIPELNVYNWGQCLFAAVALGKALEYGLSPVGMLKVGEAAPGIMKTPSSSTSQYFNGNGTATNGHIPPSSPASPTPLSRPYTHPLIPAPIYDALDLIHTMRGPGWAFGAGTHVPTPTRPLARTLFLKATLKSFLINYLSLDVLESLIKLFPGTIGTPIGGGIFYSDIPSLWMRYTISTTIHIFTGLALLAGFGMVYDLCTLLSVGLLDGDPQSWPPVMDRPWTSESMHEFWAKRWHQLLRRTFVVLGGYPGGWVAAHIGHMVGGKKSAKVAATYGGVFGAFVASGAFHECAMHAMGRGWEWAPMIFFVGQGGVLVGERVWRRVTGRRVGGMVGRMWVYAIMFIGAQPMVDSWHRRGLGGSMVITPLLSPFRLLILPVMQRLLHAYLHRS